MPFGGRCPPHHFTPAQHQHQPGHPLEHPPEVRARRSEARRLSPSGPLRQDFSRRTPKRPARRTGTQYGQPARNADQAAWTSVTTYRCRRAVPIAPDECARPACTRRLLRPGPLPDVRCFAKQLTTEWNALFTFLHNPTINATNWRADQAIRPALVTRKVCGANRSCRGAATQRSLASAIRTACQRHRNPHAAIVGLPCSRSPTVAPKLQRPALSTSWRAANLFTKSPWRTNHTYHSSVPGSTDLRTAHLRPCSAPLPSLPLQPTPASHVARSPRRPYIRHHTSNIVALPPTPQSTYRLMWNHSPIQEKGRNH